jgi:hypothetical protein
MRSLADLRAPSDIRSGETLIPLKGSGSTQTNFSFANSRRVDDPRRTSRLHFWPLGPASKTGQLLIRRGGNAGWTSPEAEPLRRADAGEEGCNLIFQVAGARR